MGNRKSYLIWRAFFIFLLLEFQIWKTLTPPTTTFCILHSTHNIHFTLFAWTNIVGCVFIYSYKLLIEVYIFPKLLLFFITYPILHAVHLCDASQFSPFNSITRNLQNRIANYLHGCTHNSFYQEVCWFSQSWY